MVVILLKQPQDLVVGCPMKSKPARVLRILNTIIRMVHWVNCVPKIVLKSIGFTVQKICLNPLGLLSLKLCLNQLGLLSLKVRFNQLGLLSLKLCLNPLGLLSPKLSLNPHPHIPGDPMTVKLFKKPSKSMSLIF